MSTSIPAGKKRQRLVKEKRNISQKTTRKDDPVSQREKKPLRNASQRRKKSENPSSPTSVDPTGPSPQSTTRDLLSRTPTLLTDDTDSTSSSYDNSLLATIPSVTMEAFRENANNSYAYLQNTYGIGTAIDYEGDNSFHDCQEIDNDDDDDDDNLSFHTAEDNNEGWADESQLDLKVEDSLPRKVAESVPNLKRKRGRPAKSRDQQQKQQQLAPPEEKEVKGRRKRNKSTKEESLRLREEIHATASTSTPAEQEMNRMVTTELPSPLQRTIEPPSLCNLCHQKNIPDSVLERHSLTETYMNALIHTKHRRKPGQTGRGTYWDPSVVIQCAQCSLSFHCGCTTPAVKDYPKKYLKWNCSACMEKIWAKENESESKWALNDDDGSTITSTRKRRCRKPTVN